MPYFPTTEEKRYTCRGCGGVYEPDPDRPAGCTVLHPPGTCCHMGERLVATNAERLAQSTAATI